MTTRTVQIAVRADRAAVWRALTDGTVTPAYYLGFSADFDLAEGAPYRYTAGGGAMITGTVVAVEPGHRLVTTFQGHWAPDVAALDETTVTFAVSEPFMPMPGVTIVSVRHEGLGDGEIATHLEMGWVTILSGLKTLLETGAPMVGAPA
jgi:uncharacterized protein YndB with AHSA1/START domain